MAGNTRITDWVGGVSREAKYLSDVNILPSVNECSCVQTQGGVSLSPKLWKLNYVRQPQREIITENLG